MKRLWPYLLVISGGAALDQVVKGFIVRRVPHLDSQVVIPGFFNLTRVHNKGAIFGLGSRSDSPLLSILLMAASLLALSLVVYYFIKTPAADRLMKVALSLVLAGALGNHLDRVFRGYVVDFLDFHIGSAHWPFFNVADSCITVGAGLLIFIFLFRRQPSCTPSS
jgi:signal peptidase II